VFLFYFTLLERVLLLISASSLVRRSIVSPLGLDVVLSMGLGKASEFERRTR
jgi:hypothetical protein